ncbi:helix-turn-helix domain-containing protein [Methylobacterium sp. E-045]|uniref:helix-turn-helix domain-containing protein n=1 Tax=Methylobacterium sp. E-045 TaxID=2836575 RepID=UPI001FBA751E|nr:helix-turn-helix domain-containing protein [Methylobacterium sp. E-045]MCJ2131173.1 helix-turn-helix domain-containing protein [Methylobacterium sp. E-045]
MEHIYSTADVEITHRYQYWHDVVVQHCIPAASRTLTDGPFEGRLSVRAVGAVDIVEMTADAHHWRRDAQHLRSGPEDNLWIGYMHEGRAEIAQDERAVSFASGDMVLYDAARQFDFSLMPQCAYLIRFPRSLLLQRCPGAERLTARIIDQQKPAATQLRALIKQAVDIDFCGMRPSTAIQFGCTLLDLAAIALEFQMEEKDPVRERDLYGRISAYILRHLEDPELNLETIAAKHNVSTRTVTRAFARHNKTPMGMVWKLRLEASYRALAEGRSRTVTEAAFDHGFSDLSHFSRSFRKTFGYSPQRLLIR